MLIALSLIPNVHATVTRVVPYMDDNKPANEATLVVILECSSLPLVPKAKYDEIMLPGFAREADALQAALIKRHIGDQVVRVTNPTQTELDELLPTLSAPNNGIWETGMLFVAAPGFGAEFGLETLMCPAFNPVDTATPDATVPFEGTLLNIAGLKQMMFEVSNETIVFLDDSPDMSIIIDFPPGVLAKGLSADNWSDQSSLAISAAGPNKNAEPGLLLALANVLNATPNRDLTVAELRALLSQETLKIDKSASIIAYSNATGGFKDGGRVVFPAYTQAIAAKPQENKAPKKQTGAVTPIVSFSAAGACAIAGGILGYQANQMYQTALTEPEKYEGQSYDDVVAQYDGYRYGAIALGGCTAIGAGLGVTVLLTSESRLSFGASPLGLHLTGSW